MKTIKCSNCGHENEIVDAGPLASVEVISDWEKLAGDDTLAKKLADNRIKKITGTIEDESGYGGWVGTDAKFVTLFLAKTIRVSLFDAIDGKHPTDGEVFSQDIVPALKKVDAAFQILGALAPPSALQLVATDLHLNRVVFTFVTIVKPEQFDLQEKLNEISLPFLLNEGACDTLGLRPNANVLDL
jgi:hypothetical protein